MTMSRKERIPRDAMLRFCLLCLGVWLHSADTLVTATVAPSIVADLGGIAYINWTISLYEVGAIIAGAAAGVFCLKFGIKRAFTSAAAIYTVGCVAAAAAPDMAAVIGGRWVQGLGGGMFLSVCYVAVEAWFEEALWNRLFGLVALVWGAGSLLGPLIGGVFLGRIDGAGRFAVSRSKRSSSGHLRSAGCRVRRPRRYPRRHPRRGRSYR